MGIIKFMNHLGISKKLIQQGSHPECCTVRGTGAYNQTFLRIGQIGNDLIHIILTQV